MTVDLLIKNARIFNSAYRVFYEGYLSVLDGRVYHACPGEPPQSLAAKSVVDANGKHVIPGLIDIHMHIESSMATPLPFGYHLASCGVTTVVAEPHEIANVKGMEGIRAMLAAGKGAPVDIFFGVPSSVPSTSAELETAGAEIGEAELLELLGEQSVICLGEVMNTRAVVGDDESKAKRLIRLVQEHAPWLPIEGHCPRLVGESLMRYIYAGVDSDHTEHTLDELRERYFGGMCVQLQHKMMKPEVIGHIIENGLFESTVLVTDDVMADKLVDEGHLNHIAALAVSLGFTPEQAVYCSTATPGVRMRLYDRGRLRPGLVADIVILNDLKSFKVDKTFKGGKLVYDAGEGYNPPEAAKAFPESFYNTMLVDVPSLSDFDVKCESDGTVKCRVIMVHPDRTQTTGEVIDVPVRGGRLCWESTRMCLAVCFERHGKTKGGKGVGLIGGATIKRGAVATSCAHDHHNLMVVGRSPGEMRMAAEAVIASGGGIACVLDGKVAAAVHLPVAGLLSEKPVTELAREVGKVTETLTLMGYEHISPVMSLCTVSLPVSPALKLTDKGLVDVSAGRIVPLVLTAQEE